MSATRQDQSVAMQPRTAVNMHCCGLSKSKGVCIYNIHGIMILLLPQDSRCSDATVSNDDHQNVCFREMAHATFLIMKSTDVNHNFTSPCKYIWLRKSNFTVGSYTVNSVYKIFRVASKITFNYTYFITLYYLFANAFSSIISK